VRTTFRQKTPLLWSILSLAWCSPLVGQWRIGAEVGVSRFWGGSQDTGGDHTSVRPYRPTTFGLGLQRQYGRYAIGLQVQYAEASLGLQGPEAVVAVDGAFTIVSISPELAVRIATVGPGNQLRLHAGPLFEVWDIIDQDSRTRLGFQGAVSLDVPLGERLVGTVVGGGAVTPSPYKDGELDLGGGAPSYDLRTLWRRRFALGLGYRL
jgi:hypothetical protein